MDSRYLKTLIKILDIPGNVWLIDFPGNGDHQKNLSANYDYNQWFDILKDLVSRLDNPVIVGHSFGAMPVLLLPELEHKIQGFVALASSPKLWMIEATKAATAAHKPDLTPMMHEFVQRPCQETFELALAACLPYYFPESSMEQGSALFKDLPFPFAAAVWCQTKLAAINYNATWVPQKLPMLIVSGTEDYICPYTLFTNDRRFHRPNIMTTILDGAGHFPWIEKPLEIYQAFKDFVKQIQL
jgi:pimeloyl-ACP methyl ester carboxylesterase